MNKKPLRLVAAALMALLILIGLVVGTLDAYGMLTWYRVAFTSIDVGVIIVVIYSLGEVKE